MRVFVKMVTTFPCRGVNSNDKITFIPLAENHQKPTTTVFTFSFALHFKQINQSFLPSHPTQLQYSVFAGWDIFNINKSTFDELDRCCSLFFEYYTLKKWQAYAENDT